MATLGSGASGDRRSARRGANSWDDQWRAGIVYLLGLLGGAVAAAAFVAAAFTWGWVDHLQSGWRQLNVEGAASHIAAQGGEKVADLGGMVGSIIGTISNQRSFSEGRLQDANRAVGDAAGARVPAARR